MNKINVLIINKDVDKKDSIIKYFSNNSLINISSNISNYDILILDYSLLDKYMNDIILSKTIIISSFINPLDIHKIIDLGIKYFLLEPFSLEDLESTIIELSLMNKKSSKTVDLVNYNLDISITNILHNLGVPDHIKGFNYIMEGIKLIYYYPYLAHFITKKLYPEIAKKYYTTDYCVERSIRHAIELSFTRASLDLIDDIFGYSLDYDKAKPTNSEYLITIANKLRLDLYKK